MAITFISVANFIFIITVLGRVPRKWSVLHRCIRAVPILQLCYFNARNKKACHMFVQFHFERRNLDHSFGTRAMILGCSVRVAHTSRVDLDDDDALVQKSFMSTPRVLWCSPPVLVLCIRVGVVFVLQRKGFSSWFGVREVHFSAQCPSLSQPGRGQQKRNTAIQFPIQNRYAAINSTLLLLRNKSHREASATTKRGELPQLFNDLLGNFGDDQRGVKT
jgi:hypothetical protein